MGELVDSSSDGAQRCKRQFLLQVLRHRPILRNIRLQIHGRGCLDVCRDVDNFFEPRYAKGDVLARNTSVMECVQSHLRSGFIDRLSSEGPTCVVGS